MKKFCIKAISAVIAVLPASKQVLARVTPVDDAGSNSSQYGYLKAGTTGKPASKEVNQALNQKVDQLRSEVDEMVLRESVFTLDEEGNVQIIGTKSELGQIIKENKKKLREIYEAREVAPSCD